MKKCSLCKLEKTKDSFHKKTNAKDGLQPHCKECKAIGVRDYYLAHRDFLRPKITASNTRIRQKLMNVFCEYLSTCKCEACGNCDPLVLEFHHVDPSTKKFHVSSKVKVVSWENLKKEIEKCQVLCANCHKLLTHQQQKSYRYKYFKGS